MRISNIINVYYYDLNEYNEEQQVSMNQSWYIFPRLAVKDILYRM